MVGGQRYHWSDFSGACGHVVMLRYLDNVLCIFVANYLMLFELGALKLAAAVRAQAGPGIRRGPGGGPERRGLRGQAVPTLMLELTEGD